MHAENYEKYLTLKGVLGQKNTIKSSTKKEDLDKRTSTSGQNQYFKIGAKWFYIQRQKEAIKVMEMLK